MPKTPAPHKRKSREGESLAERVERLADELKMAIEFDRPSILLAIYQSYFVAMDAQEALEAKLRTMGQKTERYVVDKETADIPLRLSQHPALKSTVFFVQGLQFGGPEVLRALNIRREYLVEKSIRAVFWLTEIEAAALAHDAPDFWAFRHRSVNFLDPPNPRQLVEMSRGAEGRAAVKELDSQIAIRLKLLADLPRDSETMGARAELHSTLGRLYSAAGDFDASIPYWQQAIENEEQLGDPRALALAYGGLGAAYAGLGRFAEAVHVLKQAVTLESRLAVNHNALGALYLDLGMTKEASDAFERALQVDPLNAAALVGLGDILAGQGLFDEAVKKYQKAAERDPELAAPHGRLGRVYMQLGGLEKAADEFELAIRKDNRDWRAVFDMGLVRARQDRDAEAHALWQCGLAMCQGNLPVERLNRALYMAAIGKTERALVELRSLLKKGDVPSGALRVAHQDAQALAGVADEGFEEFFELLKEGYEKSSVASSSR